MHPWATVKPDYSGLASFPTCCEMCSFILLPVAKVANPFLYGASSAYRHRYFFV